MGVDEIQAPAERFVVGLWVNASDGAYAFHDEHWFVERPERGIVLMLFEEAKQTFRELFPGEEPDDYSVNVNRLRPSDDFRPDFRPLV